MLLALLLGGAFDSLGKQVWELSLIVFPDSVTRSERWDEIALGRGHLSHCATQGVIVSEVMIVSCTREPDKFLVKFLGLKTLSG